MDINTVEAQSQRITQAYGWGPVVWHVWGGSAALKSAAQHKYTAGTQKPLVLLHGGSGSWTHWLRNVEYFAKTREVWALDIPGFGDSALPQGVTDADGLVPYVAEIFEHTFGGAAVDVLGFSFGGMTAGLVAAEYPTRIR